MLFSSTPSPTRPRLGFPDVTSTLLGSGRPDPAPNCLSSSRLAKEPPLEGLVPPSGEGRGLPGVQLGAEPASPRRAGAPIGRGFRCSAGGWVAGWAGRPGGPGRAAPTGSRAGARGRTARAAPGGRPSSPSFPAAPRCVRKTGPRPGAVAAVCGRWLVAGLGESAPPEPPEG